MLIELHIENLAVIDGADLVFDAGLNVISGETGAGKTILAHAISLLLGTRADSGLIRPGAAEASVEAVFSLPEGFFADIAGEIDLPDEDVLAVRRRISRDGRSRAFIGGRSATLSLLGELTGRLLAFSAQHEQRRLMLASRQLEILDDFAGAGLADLLDEYRLAYDRHRELADQLADLSQDYEAQAREAELLRFQLSEIDNADLLKGEDLELEDERRRLLHAQELREATAELTAVLSGDEGGAGLTDTLSQMMARLENSAGVDDELDAIAGRLQKNYYELEEINRSARDYSESVQSDPLHLGEVEERLDLIGQLKRKYGVGQGVAGSGEKAAGNGSPGGIEEILNYSVRSAERLARLTGVSEGKPALEKELSQVSAELLGLAAKLSELRQEAASRLEEEAGRHLGELAFNDCGFEVRLSKAESPNRNGADNAEFLVRLNPGMPATPLRDTASGGELSRIMLAIKSAVLASRDTATLVFDEIDAGIGGETGAAVGARLRSLTSGSQIICITHLPQIACYADAHFRVVKRTAGGQTVTAVERLQGEGVVDELCRMMGSKPKDGKARAHAGDLLLRVQKISDTKNNRASIKNGTSTKAGSR
ncbi:MAG: DNA repair protein RecN [Thermoleophilia bacterium]|nr:DNA repair protein RecN [Thermoleophilia bacterium]